MAQNPNRTRLYSEKEMGTLIQRATELQQEKSDSSAHGLSILEIERIASEIGLDPEHLRKAALELEDSSDTNESRSFWGTPFQIDLKRVAEGVVSDEQWEEIVLMLRTFTGRPGRTNDIGKTKEWLHSIDEGLGHTRVSISPRDEQTTVQIQRQYRGIAGFVYALSLLLGGAITIILLEADGAMISPLVGITLLGTGCLAALLAARTSLRIWSKQKRKKLNQIMHKVIDSISLPQSMGDEVEPAIELPELTEEAKPITMEHKSRARS